MTALDLVAAAIGWLHLDRLAGGKVHDLQSFSRNSGRVAKPSYTGCAAWVTGALSGSGWLKSVRDDLVHQTVNRALFGRVGEDPDDIREDRTRIPAHGNKRVDQVIRDCRTLAHRQVWAFFQAMSDGRVQLIWGSFLSRGQAEVPPFGSTGGSLCQCWAGGRTPGERHVLDTRSS